MVSDHASPAPPQDLLSAFLDGRQSLDHIAADHGLSTDQLLDFYESEPFLRTMERREAASFARARGILADAYPTALQVLAETAADPDSPTYARRNSAHTITRLANGQPLRATVRGAAENRAFHLRGTSGHAPDATANGSSPQPVERASVVCPGRASLRASPGFPVADSPEPPEGAKVPTTHPAASFAPPTPLDVPTFSPPRPSTPEQLFASGEGRISTPSSLPLPNPTRTPDDVASIILAALKNPDDPLPGAGLLTLHNFDLHRAELRAPKDLEDTTALFHSLTPAALNFKSATTDPPTITDNRWATQRVILYPQSEIPNPQSPSYSLDLKLQRATYGPLKGCWLLAHLLRAQDKDTS